MGLNVCMMCTWEFKAALWGNTLNHGLCGPCHWRGSWSTLIWFHCWVSGLLQEINWCPPGAKCITAALHLSQCCWSRGISGHILTEGKPLSWRASNIQWIVPQIYVNFRLLLNLWSLIVLFFFFLLSLWFQFVIFLNILFFHFPFSSVCFHVCGVLYLTCIHCSLYSSVVNTYALTREHFDCCTVECLKRMQLDFFGFFLKMLLQL